MVDEVRAATEAPLGKDDVRVSDIDSERFGIRIARAEGVRASQVDEITTRSLAVDAEMVMARCAADDFEAVHALQRAGYLLMETLVDYVGPVAPAPASRSVREATLDDVDAVERAARSAFVSYAGHYHADSRLSGVKCTEVYVSWARRCVIGEAAENIVVAEHEGRIVGFQAHHSPRPRTGQLLLVGVVPEARGLGLYRALGAYAQRWSAGQGYSELLAICHQANYASHRVFIGLGLRPARVTSTFHGWAEDLRVVGTAQ